MGRVGASVCREYLSYTEESGKESGRPRVSTVDGTSTELRTCS